MNEVGNPSVVESSIDVVALPVGWQYSKVKNLANKLKSGGTPRREKKEYWNGQIPFVLIEDMTSSGIIVNSTKETITEEGLDNSSAWIVPENSVLLSMYATIGATSVNKMPVATNQAILSIVPNQNTDAFFLAYCLRYNAENLSIQNVQSTQKNISKGIVENFELMVPSLPEQKIIASILFMVDETKSKTEEVIKKLRQLKKSLLHYLFTNGPAPHKKYDSIKYHGMEIGDYPEGWTTVDLGKYSTMDYGTSKKCNPGVNGVPVLRIPNVVRGSFNEKDIVSLDSSNVEPNKYLDEGDLLFVRTNATRENIGKTMVYHNQFEKASFASYLIRVRVDKDAFNPRYVHYFTQTESGIAQLSGRASSAADGKFNINTQILKSVHLPRPPVKDQDKIVEYLESVDRQISAESNSLSSLERLFSSLLDNLMTGKIRVCDLEI